MNKVISKTDILVCLIRFRREKEHVGLLPHNWYSSSQKNTQTVSDQSPTTLYTDLECLQIIKERDKDATAAYVKEFETEITQKLSQN